MARDKDLPKEDNRFIDSLQLDEIDFDDFDVGGDSKTTGPIRNFGGGLKDVLLTRQNARFLAGRFLKRALPEGYSRAWDAAETAFQGGRTILKNLHRDNAGEIRDLASNLEERAERLKGHVSDRQYERILKSLRKTRESAANQIPEGPTDNLNGDRQEGEDALNRMMSETFASTTMTSTRVLEEGAESRFRRERRERSLRDRVNQTFNRAMLNEQMNATDALRSANLFNEQFASRYMRRSLEVQFRTFQALKDIRRMTEVMTRGQMEGFKSLIHNTALSDHAKAGDRETQRRARLGMLSSGLGGYYSGYYNNLGRNIQGALQDQISSTLPGLNMAMGMSGGMGMSPSRMLGMGAGSLLNFGIANYGMPMLGRMIRGRVNRLNRRTGAHDQNLSYFLDNIPSMLQEFGDNYNQPTFMRGLVQRLVGRMAPSYRSDASLNHSGFHNLNQPAQFNQHTQRSIVEVIPGYLARILHEMRVLRTGDDKTPMETYDITRGVFSKKNIVNNVRDRIVTSIDKDNVRHTMDGVLDQLDNQKSLSRGAEEALRHRLLKDAANNERFNPERLMRADAWAGVDANTTAEIQRLLGSRYQFDQNGKLIGNVDNRSTRNEDSKAFAGLREVVPNPQNEIRRLLDAGMQEPLMQLGIITSNNGRETINYDKLFKLLQEGSGRTRDDHGGSAGNGGIGGPSGSGGTGGNGGPNNPPEPINPDTGELQAALYRRHSRAPVITPLGLSEEIYLDQATGLPIHSIDEIRGPVTDRQGNVIVSTRDLTLGLRTREGRLVVKRNGVGSSTIWKLQRRARRGMRNAGRGLSHLNDQTSDFRSTVTDHASRLTNNAQNQMRRIADSSVISGTLDDLNMAADRAREMIQDPEIRGEQKAEARRKLRLLEQRIRRKVRRMGNRVSSNESLNAATENVRERFGSYRERLQRLADRANGSSVSLRAKAVVNRLYGKGKAAADRLRAYRSNPELLEQDRQALAQGARDGVHRVGEAVREGAEHLNENGRITKSLRRAVSRLKIQPRTVVEVLYGKGRDARRRLQAYNADPLLFEEDVAEYKAMLKRAKAQAKNQAGDVADHLRGFVKRFRRDNNVSEEATEEPTPGSRISRPNRQNSEEYRGLVVADVYVKNKPEPVMLKKDFKEGRYFDEKTGKPIKTLNDISGPVVDKDGNIILSASDIAEGLVDKDGNALKDIDSHLMKSFGPKTGIGSVINASQNGIRRVKAVTNVLKRIGFGRRPVDLYVDGEVYPRLTALKMKAGEYHDAKTGRPIFNLDDIRGPIVDKHGNELVGEEELGHLCTKDGKPVKLASIGMRMLRRLTGGYIRMSAAYYRGLWKATKALGRKAKDHPKIAATVAGSMLAGPMGGLVALGGSTIARGIYGAGSKIAKPYYRGMASLLARKRAKDEGDEEGPISTRQPTSMMERARERRRLLKNRIRFGLRGRAILTHEQRNDPMVTLLSAINDKLADSNAENDTPRKGSWQDLLFNRVGGGEDEDDGRGGRRRGRGLLGRLRDRLTRGRGGVGREVAEDAGRAVSRGGASLAEGAASTAARGAATAAGAGAEAAAGATAGATAETAGLLANPWVAGATAGAVAVGAGVWYAMTQTWGDTIWNIRMAQYGFYGNGNYCLAARYLEKDILKNYNGKEIDYDKAWNDHGSIVAAVGNGMDKKPQMTPEKKKQARYWYTRRFVPVFARHLAAWKATNPSVDFFQTDSGFSNEDCAKYIKFINFPYDGNTPYKVNATPFDTPLQNGIKEIVDLFNGAYDYLESTYESNPKLKFTPAIFDDDAKVTVEDDGRFKPKDDGMSFQDIQRHSLDGDSGNKRDLARFSVESKGFITAPKELPLVQEYRYRSYGLSSQFIPQMVISQIMTLEGHLLPKVKFGSGTVSVDLSTDEIEAVGAEVFGDVKGGGKYSSFKSWYEGRFIPVFLTWISAVRGINQAIDLTRADTSLNYETQYKVAVAIAGTKGKLFGKEVPIWLVPSTMFDSDGFWSKDGVQFGKKRADEILSKLEELARKNPTGVNTASTDVKPLTDNLNLDRKSETLPDGGQKFNGPTADDMLFRRDTAGGPSRSSVSQSQGGGLVSPATANPMNQAATPGMPGSPYSNGSSLRTYDTQAGEKGLFNEVPGMNGPKGRRESFTAMFQKVGTMVGVDPDLLMNISQTESNLDPDIGVKGKGTAKGLFQFTGDTWKGMMKRYGPKYGLKFLGDQFDDRIYDPRINALLGAQFIKDNIGILRKLLKRDPTDTEIYMAHFLGPGGVQKFYTSDQSKLGVDVFPRESDYNPDIFKPHGKPRTLAQIQAEMDARLHRGGRGRGGQPKIPRLSKTEVMNQADDPTLGQPVDSTTIMSNSEIASRTLQEQASRTIPKTNSYGAQSNRSVITDTGLKLDDVGGSRPNIADTPAPDAPAKPAREEKPDPIAANQERIISQQEYQAKLHASAMDSTQSYREESLKLQQQSVTTLKLIADLIEQGNKATTQNGASSAPQSNGSKYDPLLSNRINRK